MLAQVESKRGAAVAQQVRHALSLDAGDSKTSAANRAMQELESQAATHAHVFSMQLPELELKESDAQRRQAELGADGFENGDISDEILYRHLITEHAILFTVQRNATSADKVSYLHTLAREFPHWQQQCARLLKNFKNKNDVLQPHVKRLWNAFHNAYKLGPWIQGKALADEILKVKTEQQYVKWIEEYKRQYQQALDMTG